MRGPEERDLLGLVADLRGLENCSSSTSSRSWCSFFSRSLLRWSFFTAEDNLRFRDALVALRRVRLEPSLPSWSSSNSDPEHLRLDFGVSGTISSPFVFNVAFISVGVSSSWSGERRIGLSFVPLLAFRSLPRASDCPWLVVAVAREVVGSLPEAPDTR